MRTDASGALTLKYIKRGKHRQLVLRFSSEDSLKNWLSILGSVIGKKPCERYSARVVLRLERCLRSIILNRVSVSLTRMMVNSSVRKSRLGLELFAVCMYTQVRSMVCDRLRLIFHSLERHYRVSIQSEALKAAESLASLNEDFLDRLDTIPLQIALSHVGKLVYIDEYRSKLLALSKLKGNN